jgi:hypothetical protein
MRKRFWCAVTTALILAGGASAQGPDLEPAATTVTLAQSPNGGPATPPSPASEILEPIAGLARTLASSDARVWANADYMFTFLRGTKLPPLVTTSPTGTPHTEAGILGETTTAPLFGGTPVDNDLRAGFRIATGIWFNNEQSFGIEAGFLMTSSQAAIFSATSTNGTILARPYIDANTNLPQALLVSFPGASNGSINIRANSGNLYGANLDLTEKAYDNDWFRLYAMVGYQFYRYDESLRVQQSIAPAAGGPFVPGTVISSNDNFSTRNEFHGFDMGYRSQFILMENLSLELLTKIAIGQMHRDVAIGGNQTTTVPGADPVTLNGGVLALSSNSGATAYTDWRVIPEVGLTLAWQVRSYLTVRAGYSLIYFNQVVRAADQLDTTINPNLLPGVNTAVGPARPAFNLTRSDMWMQSLNLGLEFTY